LDTIGCNLICIGICELLCCQYTKLLVFLSPETDSLSWWRRCRRSCGIYCKSFKVWLLPECSNKAQC